MPKGSDLIRSKARTASVAVVCTLLLAILIEALTLFGAPASSVFDLGAWGKKRILVVWAVLLVSYAALRYFGAFASLRGWMRRLHCEWRLCARRAAFLVCGFALSGCVGVVVAWTATSLGLFGSLIASSLFLFSVGGCVFIVFANRRSIASDPEKVFVPVGVVLGILIAVLTPVQTSVSADDHIHYDNALALSYLSSAQYTGADAMLLDPPYIEGGDYDHWSFSEQEYRSVLDDLNAQGLEFVTSTDGFISSRGTSTLNYFSLGYIPSAIGLWLGRLAHLPFVLVFLLGRISNVLFFFTLVYFSVRRLKSQKILVLAFSLLPSVLFVGSNYSYDIWVAGWFLFGFLRYLSWLQHPEEKLTAKEVLVVLLSFILGLGPKAIYFPILFLLLFIPKSKFPSRKFAVRYRLAIIASALLVLSTFLLPFVSTQGATSSDARGGSDVNSAGQLSFVLADPLRYAGILTNFLSGYLSIAQSASYTNFFAYLGYSSLGGLPLVMLMLVAVTDSGPANYPYALWRYRLGALALLCGTSALIASALYVSFTVVGSDTVSGCQGRYLLPLLLPFLALFFNSRIKNENSRAQYNMVVLAISVAFVLVCVSQLNLPVYAG